MSRDDNNRFDEKMPQHVLDPEIRATVENTMQDAVRRLGIRNGEVTYELNSGKSNVLRITNEIDFFFNHAGA